MNLHSILPRPLSPDNGTDSASLLGSVLTAAYFERPRARGLGWRGVRPSAAAVPAWTCRIAKPDNLVYGLRFDGERAEAGCLRGGFSLFAFPVSPDDPLLDRFPLEALRIALEDGYEEGVREFARRPEWAFPFLIAQMTLDAALDGSALRLVLHCAARRRVIAADGVAAPSGEWLIEPGGQETDVPQYRLAMPFFSALIATLHDQLGEAPKLSAGSGSEPGFAYGGGRLMRDDQHPESVIRFSAVFGESSSLPSVPYQLHVAAKLPFRRMPQLLENTGRPVLHILTGFLGSGKTTFLRGWLDYLNGRERYTGVIQNEFGKVALDAALLGSETKVEALDDGCVCCSLADSLRPGIERLLADVPAESLILETTGLANPENVYEALAKLRDLVTAGLVITVADSLDLIRHAGAAPEEAGVRRTQIEKADVLILNKADAVTPAELDALEKRIARLNPRALVLRARFGQVPYAELDAFLDAHPYGNPLPSHRPALRALNAQTHADEGYASYTIAVPKPLTPQGVEALIRQAGEGLVRAKGIILLDDGEQGGGPYPAVAQFAAGRLSFEPAPEKSDDEPYMVFIGRSLQPVQL
ncbi:MAG: GTP-binding protein [Desulfovibrionaceae bacterium]|nr:GTP-binding protein [Desulfovibrionaceae bacterium]